MKRIFITGIGTGVGKTLAAACVTEALERTTGSLCKPGWTRTDTLTVRALVSNPSSVCHKKRIACASLRPRTWRRRWKGSRLTKTPGPPGGAISPRDRY